MANERFQEIPRTTTLADLAKHNYNWDKVDEELTKVQQEHDNEVELRASGDAALDTRINTILRGNSETKDPELTDIQYADPIYTPARPIEVAGDMVRDMQRQFGTQLAETGREIADLSAATDIQLALKASQSALNETNLALAAKASQSALNAANHEIALRATYSYVDNKVAELGSMSPKGAYPTLADLQTAYPTGAAGIYLVSDANAFYVWNGSAWVLGGTIESNPWADFLTTQDQPWEV